MSTSIAEKPADLSRSAEGIWGRLKSDTEAVHQKLDERIMQGRPFESVERYGRFLQVQYDFHALVSPYYQSEALAELLPDLKDRDRLVRVGEDLRDLGLQASEQGASQYLEALDVPTALGWLYVAEGSNLGAAFLLKAAQKIGLSETFGARHLGGAAEGRGLHWKTFTAGLDAIHLSPAEEERVIDGARAAFGAVLGLVERHMFTARAD